MTTRKGSKIPNMHQRIDPKRIGLDIGYGVTKVTDGETHVKFPSVAAHAHNLKYQSDKISAKYPGDEIADEDGDWFVGDLAIKQAPLSEHLTLRGRTNNEDFNMAFRLRMMKVALAKIMPHQNGDVVHIIISTGLPVDHMPDAALLKASLIGQHKITTNNASFIANVVDVLVMPQPAGAIYSVMMTADGELNPYHTATTTGVADVGTFTLDVALDDDGEFVDAQGGTLESGIHTAQQRISDTFEAEFRAKPTPKQIEQILTKGYVKINGVVIDYSHHSREALKPVHDGLKSLMGKKWGVATHVDLILIVGGGAEVVDKDVLQAYPQAIVVDNPQMANAIGYLNYARFLARNPD
jgi:plasmid segregation protein ParM